jgi:hypothetical protein
LRQHQRTARQSRRKSTHLTCPSSPTPRQWHPARAQQRCACCCSAGGGAGTDATTYKARAGLTATCTTRRRQRSSVPSLGLGVLVQAAQVALLVVEYDERTLALGQVLKLAAGQTVLQLSSTTTATPRMPSRSEEWLGLVDAPCTRDDSRSPVCSTACPPSPSPWRASCGQRRR